MHPINTKQVVDGWWFSADLTYFNHGYVIDLGYSRSKFKENLLQGYSQSGIDSWSLTANKQWFGGKLSTQKKPISSKQLTVFDLPEPLKPVIINISIS